MNKNNWKLIEEEQPEFGVKVLCINNLGQYVLDELQAISMTAEGKSYGWADGNTIVKWQSLPDV